MKRNIHFLSYLAQVYLEWKFFRQSCREYRNTFYVQ